MFRGKWYIGNELARTGRKPADYDPVAFQGMHARYVLVIIDEAGGVSKSIFDAVYALATKPRHVFLIGLTSAFASMLRTL